MSAMSKLTEHYRLLLGVDATGRSLTFNEIEYLKTEGRTTLGPQGYRIKDCVRFVIESPLFLEK